jgi:hypothetical protein
VSELGQPFNDTTALDSIGRSSHAPEREVDAPAASVVTSPGLLAILAHNLVEARIIYRGEHGAGGAYRDRTSSAVGRLVLPATQAHRPQRRSGVRRKIQGSELPSPTNYSNFVYEHNDYGRQRDPDGQCVAAEEVQGHACPAEA